MLWSISLLCVVVIGTLTQDIPFFSCPNTCSCGRGAGGQYEAQCPGQDVPQFSVTIKTGKFVHVLCWNAEESHSNYSLLTGLKVGAVEAIHFQRCPFVESSLLKTINFIGVTEATALVFQFYNLSDTLTQKQLVGLTGIKRLTFSNDGLVSIPGNLLQDLPNLVSLDLQSNNLRQLPHMFQAGSVLEKLELGNNELSVLQGGLFRNLTRLKLLNLWHNRLENLTRVVFSGLAQLEFLDLSSNKLVTLPTGIFADLNKLKVLNLFANNFTSLPEGMLTETLLLEEFKLHDNRASLKTVPSGFLANLSKLQTVILRSNNISVLPRDVFWGSSALTDISLKGNSLETLLHDTFKDNRNLDKLDLSYNRLQVIPDKLFLSLGKLRTLNLSYNQITSIPEYAFQGLEQLNELDLRNNLLHHINSRACIPVGRLEVLNLSHNLLTFNDAENVFGHWSPLRNCLKLKTLDLANNLLTSLQADWAYTMLNLRHLNLRHNRLAKIMFADVQFLSQEVTIDLRYNNISEINLKDAESLAKFQQPNKNSSNPNSYTHVLLEYNPIQCDCNIYDLLRYFENKIDPAVPSLIDLKPGNLTCAWPEDMIGVPIVNLQSKALVCDLPGKAALGCPDPCACSWRQFDAALILDCSHRGLVKVPSWRPPVPEKLTSDPESEWILPVSAINYTELHISGNKLQTLPQRSDSGYNNVTKLYAAHNNLSAILETSLPSKLWVLELDHNNLTHLGSGVFNLLSLNPALQVTLHSNPWHCNCDASSLLQFLQDHYKKVILLSDIVCEAGDRRSLPHLSPEDLCPTNTRVVVAASVSVAMFGIVAGALAALYYCYQREVKVWLYAHNLCLWFVTEKELDKDKRYDAFVSFSHKDEEFVVGSLVPELESGPTPFKLCVHYRDWVAGEWIPHQIARSVEDSRRTLVILSPNFMESVWGRMEFRAAHKQALSEGRARVIVLLYGDVGPLDKLDPELRAYLTMNTYVKWGDPWFWEKLRYALPHRTKRPQLKRTKLTLDDKLELMFPPSLSATTPPAETVVNPLAITNALDKPLDVSKSNGHVHILPQMNGCVKSV